MNDKYEWLPLESCTVQPCDTVLHLVFPPLPTSFKGYSLLPSPFSTLWVELFARVTSPAPQFLLPPTNELFTNDRESDGKTQTFLSLCLCLFL